MRRWVTVALAENSRKILFVGKTAGGGDLFDRKLAFCQKLNRAVKTKLDQILLRRHCIVVLKRALKRGRADIFVFAYLLDIKLRIAEVFFNVANTV